MQAIAPAPEEYPHRTRAARRPWRVLFVITSSDIGGAESIMRELALRLDPREFELLVCSLRPPGRIAQEIAAADRPVLSLHMSEQPQVTELLSGTVRLGRRMDALRVDLVHSFLYRANVLARLAARLARRRPIVVSGHHTLTPLGGRNATRTSRWTRALSDCAVAASQAVRDELMRAEHVRPERIVVIPNGVDTRRYRPVDGDSVRSQLGISADTIVIGAVGRFSPEKGLHHLLQSIAEVRRQHVPIHLVLAGDGPERGRLERDTRTLQLEGHVTFLGVCRELPPVYAAMDVFALPSLEEAAPTVLLEAMACGRAVVASNVGGAREMVEHERSGLLIDPASPTALSDALLRLALDPAVRQRFGGRAARLIRERFEVSQMIDRHAQLYRELLLARHPE